MRVVVISGLKLHISLNQIEIVERSDWCQLIANLEGEYDKPYIQKGVHA